ncbi:nucleotidyltransferase family protein [Maribellus sediminis]|uniref:nucleotidyltransferase family protein n=1 Tax=Maribellus sediminis TaxID=2696285 RepID=UPI001F11159D|nr:nucleotidyltransferase family protein [Maribellus sediminis]
MHSEKEYEHLIIDSKESLLSALKKMDEERVKLLIVFENSKYKSLLSIGDLQRAIIQGKVLQDEAIESLNREDIVCSVSDNKEEIKQKMLEIRAQFMPVVNEANELIDIYFWEEIFSEEFDVSSKPKQNLAIPVVIMAGGKGSRLKPLTNIIPKPLIPIGEKTIIEKIIDNFCKSGLSNFYLSVNYLSHMIESYFNNLPDKNYKIQFYKEDTPRGTAGSLSLIKDQIKSTFFVSNCDILIDQDYSQILDYHKKNKNEITAVTAVKSFRLPYGSFVLDKDGSVNNITEKPEFTFHVNAGMYIVEPHLLDVIPDDGIFHITDLMSLVMKRNGKIGIFPVSEKSWMDIGEWNLYERFLKNDN